MQKEASVDFFKGTVLFYKWRNAVLKVNLTFFGRIYFYENEELRHSGWLISAKKEFHFNTSKGYYNFISKRRKNAVGLHYESSLDGVSPGYYDLSYKPTKYLVLRLAVGIIIASIGILLSYNSAVIFSTILTVYIVHYIVYYPKSVELKFIENPMIHTNV